MRTPQLQTIEGMAVALRRLAAMNISVVDAFKSLRSTAFPAAVENYTLAGMPYGGTPEGLRRWLDEQR
jgi:hypothetical protein